MYAMPNRLSPLYNQQLKIPHFYIPKSLLSSKNNIYMHVSIIGNLISILYNINISYKHSSMVQGQSLSNYAQKTTNIDPHNTSLT